MRIMLQAWIVTVTLAVSTSAGAAAQRAGAGAADLVPRQVVYQRHGDVELVLHVFRPEPQEGSMPLPAIVFFHGGAWTGGSPEQFFPQSRYLASRGMVAVSAQYRLIGRSAASIHDCIADARAAVAWVKAHADELGVDPGRIAVGGGSAGGHLAAAAATLTATPDTDDASDSIPGALVLFNPALDLTEIGVERLGLIEETAKAVSPVEHVRPGLPPTIIFHGTADGVVPIADVERFCRRMRAAGNACEVVPFEGARHGFFNRGEAAAETLRAADRFLVSLGYLGPEPVP